MELEDPCPVCNGTHIKISNSGYSSFNIGFIECMNEKCQYKLVVKNCSCYPEEELKSCWKNHIKEIREIKSWSKEKLQEFVLSLFKEKNEEAHKQYQVAFPEEFDKGELFKICNKCNGSGEITVTQGFYANKSICNTCRGTGKLLKN